MAGENLLTSPDSHFWTHCLDLHLQMQVGVTPPGVEIPRCVVDPTCLEAVQLQSIQDRPLIPTGADPKWRFFWRLGPGPTSTDYSAFNAAPVIPRGTCVSSSQRKDGTISVSFHLFLPDTWRPNSKVFTVSRLQPEHGRNMHLSDPPMQRRLASTFLTCRS